MPQLMFGFGFDGHGQLSNISERRNTTSDENVVVKPLEIRPQSLPTQGQSLDDHEGATTCTTTRYTLEKTVPQATVSSPIKTRPQIKIVSITWDSILFVYDDHSWFLSGFKSRYHTRLRDKNMPITSGCLMWNALVVVDNAGVCHTINPTSDQLIQETILDKKEVFLSLDEAEVVTLVVSGGKHSFVLTDSQRVASLQKQRNSHILRPLSLHVAVKQLCCGKEHTLLLSRIGAVFTFGIGGQGQLGHGDVENHEEPTIVEALEGVTITTVVAGGWHSVALSDIGDIYIWGWNERGQLGFPSKSIQIRSKHRQPSRNEPAVTAKSHTCKQSNDKEEDYINILTLPAVLDVEPWEVNILKVGCGSRHTAAITESGQLYTWGWNKYGQLGHSDTTDRDSPSLVEFFTDKKILVTDVHCGYWNTIVTTSTNADTP